MKKKLLSIVICTVSVLTACGSSNASIPTETNTTEISTTTSADNATESQETRSDLDAFGDVEAERGLFDVELTIPKEFIGESTQEELEASAKESGFKSIKLNDDGSATYKMTKQQHKKMMDDIRENINTSLKDMITSDDYPNFTDITANDDFTEFEIITKSEELDLVESISIMGFYMYGGMYNIFNGTPVDDISVTFINADSGEVISTSNSKDLGEQ